MSVGHTSEVENSSQKRHKNITIADFGRMTPEERKNVRDTNLIQVNSRIPPSIAEMVLENCAKLHLKPSALIRLKLTINAETKNNSRSIINVEEFNERIYNIASELVGLLEQRKLTKALKDAIAYLKDAIVNDKLILKEG